MHLQHQHLLVQRVLQEFELRCWKSPVVSSKAARTGSRGSQNRENRLVRIRTTQIMSDSFDVGKIKLEIRTHVNEVSNRIPGVCESLRMSSQVFRFNT